MENPFLRRATEMRRDLEDAGDAGRAERVALRQDHPSNKRLRAARSADELARLTAEFDRENVVDEFHAPSAASRRRWTNVKRKPGRGVTARV